MPNPVDVVSRMYECFNRADLDTIKREIFSPNLIWNLPGRHPLAGIKRGPDEVLAFFHQLNKSNIKVDLVNIDRWGNDTVVEVHRGYGEAKGFKLDALNCTHYHIDATNKIDKVQVYMGDQHAADNFFNNVFDYAPIPERLSNP
jgi:ketosteroid isomerase-like protein